MHSTYSRGVLSQVRHSSRTATYVYNEIEQARKESKPMPWEGLEKPEEFRDLFVNNSVSVELSHSVDLQSYISLPPPPPPGPPTGPPNKPKS